jgi:DNA-directed RNA polymerase beta' subunit
VIHPTLFKSIEFLVGHQRLINILCIEELMDEDGHPNRKTKKKEQTKDQPFYGIGMEDFRLRFQEIIDYYYSKSSNKANKKEYYDDIMANKDKIFCQSIPVFTTHLRPYDASEKRNFRFEGTNGTYNMMSRLVASINNDSLKIFRKKKEKNQLLYDLQMKYNELNDEIDNILSGKKGNIRQLTGGRYNFSSRNVIVQNPKLRIDQITLPYKCLVEFLQQQIINVLQKTYNMSYNDAWNIWYKANIQKDELVVKIINGLMFANPYGLPIIINRNPTIARGGILQVFCVGMTDTFTMGIPLQILKLLAADFDGDVLNIFYIINKAFYERAFQVLNPRNSMYISNNDGKLNMDVVHQRDTLINSNTLVRLGRGNYTPEQIAKLEQIKRMAA